MFKARIDDLISLGRICALLFALTIAAESGLADPPGPTKAQESGLSPQEFSFDFGWIMVDADVHHVFHLENKGPNDISIQSATCNEPFITVERFANDIKSHSSGDIAIRVLSDIAPPSFDAKIEVRSNDSLNALLTLHVLGRRTSVVRVEPSVAAFPSLQSGDIQIRTISIANTGSRPMRVTLESPASTGAFKFSLLEKTPGTEFELLVRASSNAGTGTLESEAVLATNLPQNPTIRIPITAMIQPQLEIVPPFIEITPVSKSESTRGAPRRAIRIVNHGFKPAKLLEVKCEDSRIRLASETIEEGRLYQLLLDFPADYLVPNPKTSILITTDVPEQREISVPVSAMRAPDLAKPQTSRPVQVPKAMELEGKPAPQFQLPATMAGLTLGSADLVNWPVTVLNFVAPNCGFCKRQLPQVETLHKEFEPFGVRFVNVSQTMHDQEFSPQDAVNAYLAAGSNLEVVIDRGNQVGVKFNAISYPTLFVIGSDGVVRRVIVGAKPNMNELLGETLRAMVSGSKN